MRIFGLLLFLSFYYNISAQSKVDSLHIDKDFLEDQFYIGVTYNFLVNLPDDVTQRNLSYGLQFGMLKDVPLSLDRKFALGLGLGYAINTYYSNLYAAKESSDISYTVLGTDVDYKRSKLESHIIELPLEFRWRDANASDFKFWRVYAGVKLGYVLSSRSKFVSDLGNESFNNSDIEKFQYGLTMSLGYNTFNFYAYYGLNTLFQERAILETNPIAVRPLQIGLIFYIL